MFMHCKQYTLHSIIAALYTLKNVSQSVCQLINHVQLWPCVYKSVYNLEGEANKVNSSSWKQ